MDFISTADDPYGDGYTNTPRPTAKERLKAFTTFRLGGRTLGEWKARNNPLITARAKEDVLNNALKTRDAQEREHKQELYKQERANIVADLMKLNHTQEDAERMAAAVVGERIKADIAAAQANTSKSGLERTKADAAVPGATDEVQAKQKADTAKSKNMARFEQVAGEIDTPGKRAQQEAAEATAGTAEAVGREGTATDNEQDRKDVRKNLDMGEINRQKAGAIANNAAVLYRTAVGQNMGTTADDVAEATAAGFRIPPVTVSYGASLVNPVTGEEVMRNNRVPTTPTGFTTDKVIRYDPMTGLPIGETITRKPVGAPAGMTNAPTTADEAMTPAPTRIRLPKPQAN